MRKVYDTELLPKVASYQAFSTCRESLGMRLTNRIFLAEELQSLRPEHGATVWLLLVYGDFLEGEILPVGL